MQCTRRLIAGIVFAWMTGFGSARAASILFVGNSFLYGANSPVRVYRPDSVADLNGDGVGGVPALFALFAHEAGLDYHVSLETAPGVGLDYHWDKRRDVLDRPWDDVVLSGYSTLDRDHPGDATMLTDYAGRLAAMFHCRNAATRVHLNATWTRADQTYLKTGHWYGRSVSAMALDVRAGNDAAAAASPYVSDVIPVGEAWNRAFANGLADPNPYDGVAFGQLDLWSWDQYHASTAGYYLEALVIFGSVTHHDPLALGTAEKAGADLGISEAQVRALEQVAHDELAAQSARPAPVRAAPARTGGCDPRPPP
jgi:hypothetical protein